MSTKLKLWGISFLESGWLAALIVAPLFFNVYSSRVFEPDKISMVRSIALSMVAVAILVWLEGWFGGESGRREREEPWWSRAWHTPLVPPALLILAAYLLSTLFSVTPRISIWGSYQRLQGTYSFLSYMIMFAAVLLFLRRRQQMERILWTITVTSLPIALYGVVQHHRLDSLPWGGDVVTRVAANAGNAIFLAAYLIMAFFVTLALLVRSVSKLMSDDSSMIESIRAGVLLFILAVQSLAIIYTKSRGPWLGWMGGIYLFGLVGFISLRKWGSRADTVGGLRKFLSHAWLGWLAFAAAGAIFLVVLNIPGSPLEPLREMPYFGRLGEVFQTEHGTGRVRVLIWEGAVKLVEPHAPLKYPDGRTDRWNFIRPLIGYGPEAMWVAYNPFYPPDLAHVEKRNASPDRAHNETFDALVTTGLFGFLAETILFASVFYFVLKWMGLIEERKDEYIFITFLVVGGLLGFLIPVGLGRPEFLGVGIPAGYIIAFILYATWVSLSHMPGGGRESNVSGEQQLLLSALLAALVAHYIEIHFGIAIGATRTYFWILAALLVVVGTRWQDISGTQEGKTVVPKVEEEQRQPTSRRRRKGKRRTSPAREQRVLKSNPSKWALIFTLSFVAAFILVILAYDFTTNGQRYTSAWNIIRFSFTTRLVKNKPVFGLGIFWLMVFTWIIAGVLAVVHHLRDGLHLASLSDGIESAGIYFVITFLFFWVFALAHAAGLASLASFRAPSGLSAFESLADQVMKCTINTAFIAIFLFVFLISFAIWWEVHHRAQRWAAGGFISPLMGALFLVAAIVLAVQTNLAPIQADEYYKQAQGYDNAHQWDAAIILYRKAIDKTGGKEDFYYLFLGRAEMEKAKAAKDERIREEWFDKAESSLLKAQQLNPLNTDHTANLARLYRTRAEVEKNPAKKREYLEESLQYYKKAIMLSPHAAHLRNEIGLVYLMMGDRQKAFEAYQSSLALDKKFDQTYLLLGDWYRTGQEWDKAAEMYARAAKLKPSVSAYVAMGFAYARAGKLDKAIEANLKAYKLSPRNSEVLRNLAVLYEQKRDYATALRYAQAALRFAPEKDKAALEKMISDLEGKQ